MWYDLACPFRKGTFGRVYLVFNLVNFVVKVVTKPLLRFPIPHQVRYDEIIVKLFLSATSKGFSVYHYPIAFFQAHGITKHTAIFGRLFIQELGNAPGGRHSKLRFPIQPDGSYRVHISIFSQ